MKLSDSYHPNSFLATNGVGSTTCAPPPPHADNVRATTKGNRTNFMTISIQRQ